MIKVVKLSNCNGAAIIDPEFDCRNLKPGDLYVGNVILVGILVFAEKFMMAIFRSRMLGYIPMI